MSDINIQVDYLETCLKEAEEVILMIKKIIQEVNADDFTEEGLTTFFDFASREMFMNYEEKGFVMFKAVEKSSKKIVGIISMRKKDNHLSLFFVSKSHWKRGIGRMLFDRILKEVNPELDVMDVNSSTVGIPVYVKFGFKEKGEKRVKNGITSYNMVKKLV